MKLVRFKDEVAPLYVRIASRIVSNWIGKRESVSYQCTGERNWDYADNHVDVQVPKEQIMHWVLRSAGFSVSVSEVEKAYNIH